LAVEDTLAQTKAKSYYAELFASGPKLLLSTCGPLNISMQISSYSVAGKF
jgi:hypothetical protein